jgi:2-oxoisovalerate dehydrogenase E2 component (dihydrolipoyl transacylase)
MNAASALRRDLKALAERHGVKLSYMPLLLKAASLALRDFPVLNASLSPDESEIVYHAAHNIGLAMDTPNGLVVPNVKDVHTKSILEIAADINALQQRGAAGKLGPADLTGGTFTLSNIGVCGCRRLSVYARKADVVGRRRHDWGHVHEACDCAARGVHWRGGQD